MMDPTHNSLGHELDAGDVRGIVVTGVSLAAGVAIVLLFVYGIFVGLAHNPTVIEPNNPMAETTQQEFPPVPRLSDHPTVELQDLHTYEDKILSTYGWTNKSAGVVRIPIDQAMELQLKRGFPVRAEAPKK